MTSVNSDGSLEIGGGAGAGVGGNKGSDGAGIKPAGDGNYTVYGDLTLPCDVTIPEGAMVVIPEGASLTVPEGVTLTNNGTIKNDGGSFINDGTLAGAGQHPADDRYAINYAAETITIADGYAVYTAETGGGQIQSGGSITDHIGQSLYIQQAGSEAAGRAEIKIPARPQAPSVSSVSIDYSGEKLNFPSGVAAASLEYALSLSDPDWKDVPDGAALSDMGWDGSAAKTYRFRTGATDASFASSAASRAIEAPARPTKPADPTTAGVTSGSVTVQVVSGQQYRVYPSSRTPGEWETPAAADGSHTWENLQPGTEYTVETRYASGMDGAGQQQFASWPASVTVTTERADSALAVEPSSTKLTYGDTLTVKVTPGIAASGGVGALSAAQGTVELKRGDAVLASAGATDADGSYTLSYDTTGKGLPVGQSALTLSYGGSASLKPSTAEVTVDLGARPVTASVGDTPSKTFDGKTDVDVALSFADGALAGSDSFTGAVGGNFSDGNVGDDKPIMLGSSPVWTDPDAAGFYSVSLPENVTGSITAAQIDGELTIDGDPAPGGTLTASYAATSGEDVSFQWSLDGQPIGGAVGSAYTAKAADAGRAITVTATAADANHVGSVTSEPVVVRRPYVPPATPSGPDWGDVADEIAGAGAGGRVVVDMGGETELPGDVLEALAGRDVTIVLQMGGGVSWEIYGADVPEGESFSDLDMGVDLGTDGIPVSVTNLVTGEAGVVQATLAHDGEFGFGLTLVAPLGEKSGGLVANLYRYDEGAGLLRFETSSAVSDGGVARLRLDHASQWAVALDDRSHALPFPDAAEGEWYSEPLRWAWLSGVVAGYGDGTAGPGRAVTRAEAAAILWNAAGQPETGGSLPADVPSGEWYSAPVAWALASGAFSGNGDGSFSPAGELTREQAACVLFNRARAAGEDASARADLSGFADAASVSAWAADALSWAVAEGVLSGTGEGLLEPGRAIARSELCATLMNWEARE